MAVVPEMKSDMQEQNIVLLLDKCSGLQDMILKAHYLSFAFTAVYHKFLDQSVLCWVNHTYWKCLVHRYLWEREGNISMTEIKKSDHHQCNKKNVAVACNFISSAVMFC